MGGYDGQRGSKDAGLNHAVCVAIRRCGDLDEEIMGAEGGWVGERYGVDLIRFVKFNKLK